MTSSHIDLSKLTANDDLTPVLGGYWPGIQIYYPPIKFNPLDGTYESMEQAKLRLQKHAYKTKAHTVLFDLEDGCRQKAMSRELLIQELPKFPERNFQIAVRINPFRTDEYEEDLKMLKQIHKYIDVIVLAKAGEVYGDAEIRDLSSWLVSINANLTIQPIIEHPKSLQIASDLMDYSTVKHVVFGIHDFSKAMAYKITPEGWIDELKTFFNILTMEARIKGAGVIGGVEVLLTPNSLPDSCLEKKDIRRWLDLHGDDASRHVYAHARKECAMGLTGKQVITPNHINVCKVAFTPSPKEIEHDVAVLKAAIEADALLSGAIRYNGEMLDPPMFGKALQNILRAYALRSLSPEHQEFALTVLNKMPIHTFRENWPYGQI
ncbi:MULTISPECIES: HpcH/HpaI aldolase/citrate lyase family protein [Malaciobacter]|uniref:Aldolase n=2 Tax=Malaciobacter TaxID=2321114 RepID=A0A347TKA3_9BACT|nr:MULTISPECIES: aldolase/citrate lyase family protein [Malaciobacter]AXX87031.1 putative (3S)-malyl-CoA thioesterase [Malaciobacter marinus]PHO08621.1 aldolase [Malaciobacter canalis]PHO11314.1 aldolase [Malaciobacter marinus]PHO14587.1 aldolase [Malaciobacter marinus]QEE32812.1 putative (3S)-malyl-CoA thioesterase [Malaciobacter canalis]